MDRILIVGDTLDAPTGYGIGGQNISWCLAKKYEVHYLGLQATIRTEFLVKKCGQTRRIVLHPNLPREPKLDDFGEKSLPILLKQLEPDLLITINDIQMVKHVPKSLCTDEARIRIADLPARRKLSELAMKMQLERVRRLWEEQTLDTQWLMYAPQDGEPPLSDWVYYYLAADRVVAFSKYGQYVFKKYYNLDVPYIYAGYDTELFKPLPKANELRDKFIIGNINRNQPRKQPLRTIEAFAKFAKDKEDVMLYLQMDWNDPFGYPIELHLREIHKIPPYKILRPKPYGMPYEEIPYCYAQMDINVNSHAGEGFGLCSIEGFAMGKPYVATDYTTTRELVYEGEPSPRGIAVPYSELYFQFPKFAAGKRALIDTNKLAEAFEMYYRDRDMLVEHSRNAMEWVKKHCALPVIEKRWIEEVENTLSNARK